MDDFKVNTIYAESPMYSEKYGFAGTPDIVCEINNDKNVVVVVDIKTGLHSFAAPQLYVYEILFREHSKCRKSINKYVLYLPKNGGAYQFKKVVDTNALNFFYARLSQWNYLKCGGSQ